MPNHAAAPIHVTTRDGDCRAYVFQPATDRGPWPAVIVYMDAFGIRPALLDLGQRIADLGYSVLVPDLFYRSGPYAVMDPHAFFSRPDTFKGLKERFMVHTTVANVMSDTQAFLEVIVHQPAVQSGPVGTVGYCMGGRFALAAAGTSPARVAACATFHGGNLATDAPDSPHLLADKMHARAFVAGATGDGSFPDAMKARLEAAFSTAHVAHTVETWPAQHGWTFYDTPVYDAVCFERHLRVLDDLFGATLRLPRADAPR